MTINRLMAGAVLVAALAIPRYARAHAGHAHKIMGTVSTRHDNLLDVRDLDGKISTITVNENTKIVRGKLRGTPDDIKAGARVVVTTTETKGKDGKTTMIATEVRLPEAVASR